jgi:hypothetical protein
MKKRQTNRPRKRPTNRPRKRPRKRQTNRQTKRQKYRRRTRSKSKKKKGIKGGAQTPLQHSIDAAGQLDEGPDDLYLPKALIDMPMSADRVDFKDMNPDHIKWHGTDETGNPQLTLERGQLYFLTSSSGTREDEILLRDKKESDIPNIYIWTYINSGLVPNPYNGNLEGFRYKLKMDEESLKSFIIDKGMKKLQDGWQWYGRFGATHPPEIQYRIDRILTEASQRGPRAVAEEV